MHRSGSSMRCRYLVKRAGQRQKDAKCTTSDGVPPRLHARRLSRPGVFHLRANPAREGAPGRGTGTRGRAGTSRSVELGNFNLENFSFFLRHVELFWLYSQKSSTCPPQVCQLPKIGQLQLCNEDTPFAFMCVSWLLSMTPQAASTCCRWSTSVAATREISQRRYSGSSSSFVDSTSLLPVASSTAARSRT